MNVSSHEEYGLRCALRLARFHGRGPLSASKIAEAEGISVEYVSKFMHLFRKAGLVAAVRGTQGGFQLSRSPSELRLKEVLSALDSKGVASQNFCAQFSGKKEICANFAECSVRPLWSLLTFYFDAILEQVHLGELLDSEVEVKARIEQILEESLQNSKRKVASR